MFITFLFTSWYRLDLDCKGESHSITHTALRSKVPLKYCLVSFQDACIGDSGGPLWKWMGKENPKATIIGVFSRGRVCARRDAPGIYTRTKKYLPWIHKHAQNGKCWRNNKVKWVYFKTQNIWQTIYSINCHEQCSTT